MRNRLTSIMRTTIVLLFLIPLVSGSTQPAHAQEKHSETRLKYWISFVDKDNGVGKGPAAVEPDFVTERALKRRAMRALSADKRRDAPVSSFYKDKLRARGVKPIVESRWLNAVSAFLTEGEVRELSRLDFVQSVDAVAQSVDMSVPPPPVVVAGAAMPDASLLDYGRSLDQLQAINAIEPIEDGYIGEGVLLGFLDTTTDTLHPALEHLYQSGRIVALRDFTVETGLPEQSNRHGLNTSSTALAFDDGNLIGACYGAEYIFATTEYAPFERNQEEDFFVAGMEWMERMGADIVNVSLGYSTFDSGEKSYTYEDMDGKTAKTTIASDIAVEMGVVVVASAGNEGSSSWRHITSPADGFGVIAAGAVNSSEEVAGFSGRGPTFDGRIKPDVAALGVNVSAAARGGDYGRSSGTSFSSPLTASIACQILQANPMLNPADVRSILRSTASQPASPDNDTGWGVVDAAAAVNLSKGAVTSIDEEPSVPNQGARLTVYPNPASERAVVGLGLATGKPDQPVDVALYDILGRRIVLAAKGDAAGDLGTFNLELDGLAPGLYLVRTEGLEFELVKSLVVQ